MLINLNGVYVESSLAAVVRESSLDPDQTIIFTSGQSAIDGGHLIDMPIDDVIERLCAVESQALAARLLEEIETETDLSSSSSS